MRHAFFAAILLLPAAAASAQPAPESADPAASDARFQIERQGDQFIRLDRKSGAVSICTIEGSTLDCRAGADERAALEAEIERLAEELEQVRTAEADKGPTTGISKDGKEITLKLPSESEIQDAVGALQDMLRRFVEAVKGFANDLV